MRRQPDLIAEAHSVHALQNEFEIERQLQFADHHDGWVIVPKADNIAVPDFSLHRVAQALEEALDG
ncbi:hypothetical protein ASE63_03885 [Bosea sp. Root381]|nr:hypothetical protein ASE63_03885 [Bosea sp. Root381]